MPYNVEKQIQEAMERDDFENLPGKGKRQWLEGNPFVPHEARIINGLLKDNGLAPRWIEVNKEIHAGHERTRKVLGNIKRRRRQLEATIRAHSLKHDRVRPVLNLNENGH